MPRNLQIKYWIRLIKALEVITKSHVNTNLAFGVGLMNNIVSMDNFLVRKLSRFMLLHVSTLDIN